MAKGEAVFEPPKESFGASLDVASVCFEGEAKELSFEPLAADPNALPPEPPREPNPEPPEASFPKPDAAKALDDVCC